MSAVLSSADGLHLARIQRWLPPDVSLRGEPEPEAEPELPPPPPPPTEEEIAAIKEAARQEGIELGYREGYEAGYQAGRAQAEQEAAQERAERAAREQEWRRCEEQRLAETVAALEGIAHALADPLAESIEVLEPELLALVSALARRVILAELNTRPELIQQVLDEALKQLPSRNHPVRVQVNPEDQAILEAYAQTHDERIAWIPDPAIERGGCRVLSGPSRIDASLETRLGQGIEALWGELGLPGAAPEVSSQAADPYPGDGQGHPGEGRGQPAVAEKEGDRTAGPSSEAADRVASEDGMGVSEGSSWFDPGSPAEMIASEEAP